MSPCKAVRHEDGSIGFYCGENLDPDDFVTCHLCGRFADYLCDYPVGEGKTCDVPLCAECVISVGAERPEWTQVHYCPAHGKEALRASREFARRGT